jgi:hypothetical protein
VLSLSLSLKHTNIPHVLLKKKAFLLLAMIYEKGMIGVPQDKNKSVAYFKKIDQVRNQSFENPLEEFNDMVTKHRKLAMSSGPNKQGKSSLSFRSQKSLEEVEAAKAKKGDHLEDLAQVKEKKKHIL